MGSFCHDPSHCVQAWRVHSGVRARRKRFEWTCNVKTTCRLLSKLGPGESGCSLRMLISYSLYQGRQVTVGSTNHVALGYKTQCCDLKNMHARRCRLQLPKNPAQMFLESTEAFGNTLFPTIWTPTPHPPAAPILKSDKKELNGVISLVWRDLTANPNVWATG